MDARADPGFVVMARTDALANEGLDQAIDRAVAYVKAGAGMQWSDPSALDHICSASTT